MDDSGRFDGRLTADPRHSLDLMRRFGIVMFFVGALTTVSGVWVTAESHSGRVTQVVVASVFLVCGIALVVLPPRRVIIEIAVVISILDVGVLIAGAEPLGMAPMGYLWPISFTAYFFPRRVLIGMCLLSTATLSVGLLLNDHYPLKLDTLFGASASVYVVAGMMSSMNRREDTLRRELERHAGSDPLTGLLNRRGFDPLLRSMIARASFTPNHDLAFVMFDLDHFKLFNDLHGHLAGDDALRSVAQILLRQCGPHDAVARFGGEEFAVAMPGADRDNARSYANRVAAALQRECTDAWQLTISAGISTMVTGDDSNTLTARADDALYAAKRAGRNRAAWWDTQIVVGPPFAS